MNEIVTLAETILDLLTKSEVNAHSTLIALDIARMLHQNNQDKLNDIERAEVLEQCGLKLTAKAS
jgi:hypothetical protein